MLPASYDIEFITPLFSKGFYEELPEIRPPSIRGQLHWWFRALGGHSSDENLVFGGVRQPAVASKVVVRVSGIVGNTGWKDTLPHKRGGAAAQKMAYLPGTRFSLHFLPRLGGLDAPLQEKFGTALEAWLLMGSLGLRTTRGAGSFRWKSTDSSTALSKIPQTFQDYEAQCSALLKSAPFRFTLLSQEYTSAEAARHDCSDTIGGRDDHPGEDSLKSIRNPLGCLRPQRKTSPLRFRVVAMEGRYRIAALWDTRIDVTTNSDSDLKEAIRLLVAKNKPIGHQLADSAFAR